MAQKGIDRGNKWVCFGTVGFLKIAGLKIVVGEIRPIVGEILHVLEEPTRI